MLAKHGSRPSPTTPWNSNGESPWNIYDETPLFVTHDSRLVHQNTCSSVRCSCSRCSSASPSTVLCSVCTELKMCVRFDLHFVHTSFVYISMTYINVCNVCNVCRLFQVRSAVFQNMSFFYKLNFNLKLPYTQYTHLYSPRVSSLFTLSNCTHICTHTVHTWGSSVHTFHFPISYVH